MFLILLSKGLTQNLVSQPSYQQLALPEGHTIRSLSNFNLDNNVDLLTSTSPTTLQILLYNPKNKTFKYSLTIQAQNDIKSVLVADYNFDGFNDVLIVGSTLQIVYLNGCVEGCKELGARGTVGVVGDVDEVALIDLNGGRVPHMVVRANDEVYIMSSDTPTTYSPAPDSIVPTPITPLKLFSIVDVNNDCYSDLVMVDQSTLNFYTNTKFKQFKLRSYFNLMHPIIDVSWGDMNHDGVVDLVAVVKDQDGYAVKVIIGDRKYAQKFCAGDQSGQAFKDDSYVFTTRLQGQFKAGSLYLADLNIDGFPQIITIEDDSPKLRLNNRCEQCTDLNQNTLTVQQLSNRHYKPFTTTKFLQKYEKNALSFTPFDFKEDGSYDLLVNYQDQNGVVRMDVLVLSTQYDAFILKVLPLGGPKEGGNGLAWGVSLHWYTTDINGKYLSSVGAQNPRPSTHKISIPYLLAGLGRTNNYVQTLTVGYNSIPHNTRQWSPIIPNSQLIVTPVGKNPDDWLINIYIKPTDKIYVVLFITVGILGLLGLVIFVYHRKEKEEDNHAREQFFHMIR